MMEGFKILWVPAVIMSYFITALVIDKLKRKK